jgi:hypothetical protein
VDFLPIAALQIECDRGKFAYQLMSEWHLEIGLGRSAHRLQKVSDPALTYDCAFRLGQTDIGLDAPVGRSGLSHASLVDGEGPFYAVEVPPSYVPPISESRSFANHCTRITFTYGGVPIDEDMH